LTVADEIQGGAPAADARSVRKGFVYALPAAVALALVGLLVALGLPAWHARQDRRWVAAGQRAMAHVALPAPFRPQQGVPCRPSTRQRCFFSADGDPSEYVDTVRTALASVATGAVRGSCRPTGDLPNMAGSCFLHVPVRGSRLLVALYPGLVSQRPASRGGSVYGGTWVGLLVEPRP